MTFRSRQRAQRFAQIPRVAHQMFDLRVRILPNWIRFGQQRASGLGQGETSATAILLVDRDFQKPTSLERFEISRKGRAVHREKGRDTAKCRWIRPVERHQQRELTVSEIERPQHFVEAARQHTGRTMNMQAQAIVTYQVRGGEWQLNIFHDTV